MEAGLDRGGWWRPEAARWKQESGEIHGPVGEPRSIQTDIGSAAAMELELSCAGKQTAEK